MTDVLWKDDKGRLTGRIAENGIDLLHSSGSDVVAISAHLLTKENGQTTEILLLEMLREEAWAVAHAILSLAEATGWNLPKPLLAPGPDDPRKMN